MNVRAVFVLEFLASMDEIQGRCIKNLVEG